MAGDASARTGFGARLEERLLEFLDRSLNDFQQHLERGAGDLSWAPERFEACVDAGEHRELLALRLLDLLGPGSEPVRLRDAVDRAVQAAALSCPKAITFRRAPGFEAPATVDARFERVLTELLICLARCIGEGGTIELRATEPGFVELGLDEAPATPETGLLPVLLETLEARWDAQRLHFVLVLPEVPAP